MILALRVDQSRHRAAKIAVRHQKRLPVAAMACRCCITTCLAEGFVDGFERPAARPGDRKGDGEGDGLQGDEGDHRGIHGASIAHVVAMAGLTFGS